jgi:hypothetical protein
VGNCDERAGREGDASMMQRLIQQAGTCIKILLKASIFILERKE